MHKTAGRGSHPHGGHLHARFITAQDIKIGKPDPEPYLKGASMLGFAPQDCLVIEDASAGVRSGKAAGARVIAFQTTESNDLLVQLGADWIVKDCSSLSLEKAPPPSVDPGDMIINVTLSGIQPSK